MSKERKPLTASSTMSEKEKALQAIKATEGVDSTDQKESHRYNIEIPNDLFIEIKAFIKEKGYNLKGFFLAAAKEKIRRKSEE